MASKYWNVKALKVRYTHIQTYVQRRRKSLYFKEWERSGNRQLDLEEAGGANFISSTVFVK